MKYKHGIAVMRLQPLHLGHVRLIDQMLNECEHVTVAIGSYEEHGTEKNPFLIEDRLDMLENVFGDLINITAIEDIGRPDAWSRFALGHVLYYFPELPIPDAIYEGIEKRIKTDTRGFLPPSGSLIRVQRNIISGTLIRQLMRENNEEWKTFIPEENIELLENLRKNYKNVV